MKRSIIIMIKEMNIVKNLIRNNFNEYFTFWLNL